jgi:hypothetical protein
MERGAVRTLPCVTQLRVPPEPAPGGLRDFREFLTLAFSLVNGATEAEWRTVVSRAYYAAFHVATQLLGDLDFVVPQGDQAHAFAWLRLSNSGHPDVNNAGGNLNHLRSHRNRADDTRHPRLPQADAVLLTQLAAEVIQALDDARQEPTCSQITSTIQLYERNVLRTVTWKPIP